MIELCGTKILIFGTKIHFRRCFDIKIPVMHSVPWWLSFAIWFCFSNDSYVFAKKEAIRVDGILIFDCLWLLIFMILVIFAKIERLVSRQVEECSLAAIDAYLDKDNFIRTRKCENLFLGAKIKIGKVKISQKCQDVCPIMIFIIYFQDFKLPIQMT